MGSNALNIPLPGIEGGSDTELRASIGTWLGSWAMRDLAAVSGWRWPLAASVQELAHQLAILSKSWDSRGRAAELARTNFVERSSMPSGDAVVIEGRQVDPDRVITAARALGLVDSPLELEFAPTDVAVLSGTARANVNRARFAAQILDGVQALPRSLVGLTAHRELGAAERASCAELGLADTDTEWTTLRDALVDAFDLGSPTSVEQSALDEGDRAARFAREAVYRWYNCARAAELIVVPSPSAYAENPRPANTGDQLHWWLKRPGGPTDSSAMLLVTTQIYVPYQQLVAIRILRSAAPHCRLSTIGVTAATGTVPTRKFTAQDYLQEIRSALIAAAALVDDLSVGN